MIMTAKIMRTGLFLAILLAAGGAYAKGRVSGYHNYGGYGHANTLYQWEIGDKADGSDTRLIGLVRLSNANVFGYDPQLANYGDIAMLSDRRVLLSHRNAANVQSVSVLTCLYDSNGLLTNCVLDWTGTESGRPISPLPNGAFACHRGTTIAFYAQTGPNTWALYATPASPDNVPYDMAGLITPATNEVATGHYSRNAFRTRPSGWVAQYNGGGYNWGSSSEGEGLRNDLLANGWLISSSESRPTVIMDGTETNKATYNGAKGRMLNANGTDIVASPWATLNDGRAVRVAGWGWAQSGVTWEIFDLMQNPVGQPSGSIGATGYTFQKYTASNLVGTVVGDYMYLSDLPRVVIREGATGITDNAAWLVGTLVSTGAYATTWGIYWGTSDAGKSTSGWSGGLIDFGTATEASATNSQQVSSLTSGAPYFYRVCASNVAGVTWSPVSTFSTFGAPNVDNDGGALSLRPTSESLRGRLLGGNPNPAVWVYWGTTDGGTDKSAWDRPVLYMGQLAPATFNTNVYGLLANQNYYYRCYASNSFNDAWAPTTTNFVTAPPAIAINDVTVTEGAPSTTTPLTFTITLSATSVVDVTVNYVTANNSATVADNDYTAASGTLTIPAGALTGTIPVNVLGDNLVELTETFYLNLSNPTNATLPDNQGVGTITADDTVIHVRGDGLGNDANGGYDWGNAFATLQKALSTTPGTVPIEIRVQASGSGQRYQGASRIMGYYDTIPYTISFQGGWENVDVAPAQTGRSLVVDTNSVAANHGISFQGGNHGNQRSLTFNNFIFSNVVDGVHLDITPGTDGGAQTVVISNSMIVADRFGIYIDYPKPYPTTGPGGPAKVTARNVDIVAGRTTNAAGVYVRGSWMGSSITADDGKASTIACLSGTGVVFSALNDETHDATFSNLVVYSCSGPGIYLDGLRVNGAPTPSTNWYRVQSTLLHCTIAGNGGDGVQMPGWTSGSWSAATNSIFANNGGRGINLGDSAHAAFSLPEDYNVFFNNALGNLMVTGQVQTVAANTSVADPLFKAQSPKPAPWYYLGSSSSSAYKNAADGSHRGAYQQSAAAAGTLFLLY
jgi:hypothetical protein